MTAPETIDPQATYVARDAGAGIPGTPDEILLRLRAGVDQAHPNQARLDLSGARLIEADLSGLDLTDACLRGADLSRADLRGTTLIGADLSDAILSEADLTGAELTEATLDRVILNDAILTGAELGRASLRGAMLLRADFTRASLIGADLHGADLTLATLAGVRAKGADWSEANVVDVDLSGAELDCGNMRAARFDGSDLRGARLRSLRDFKRASWLRIDLREIDFTGAYLCRSFIHDQNYLAEFRGQSRASELIYRLWLFTSDCGRSMLRWSFCTVILVVAFALGYTHVALDYGLHPTPLSPLYFSVVTMTTLGFGDVRPVSMAAQWLVMFQVVAGYVMLGGLLSILSKKMATRSE